MVFMEMKRLLEFIDFEDSRLNKYYDIDNDKKILARTVKLMEELGELSNEILSHGSLQRKSKMDRHDKEKIKGEFADVVITAFLLAKAMGIDMKSALEEKINKINNNREV